MEAAMQQLGAALKLPGTTPKVASLQLLGELGLDVVQRELEADIIADGANIIAIANGEAGDRAVKYKVAVAQMGDILGGAQHRARARAYRRDGAEFLWLYVPAPAACKQGRPSRPR